MNLSDFSGKLFLDPCFKVADPAIHHTIIRLDHNGLTLVVADKKNKRIVFAALTRYETESNKEPEIISQSDLHLLSTILTAGTPGSILFSGTRAILFPGVVNDTSEATGAFGLCFDPLKDETVMLSPVEKIGATLLFGLNKPTFDLAKKLPNNYKMIHLGSVMIENDHQRLNKNSNALCSVYLENHDFFVHVIKQKKTSYFNSFGYKSPEEFVYYLVAIANTLEIPLSELPVTIAGPVDADNATITGLMAFCPNVSISKSVNINCDIIPEADQHKFLELTAIIS